LKKNTDIVRGVLGSYEMMKSGLQRNLDYVVVPYPVWDFLFEYYGGGPPLPRMVDMRYSENDTSFCDAKKDLVAPIPESLHIVTHPWIIHCQVRKHLTFHSHLFELTNAIDLSIRLFMF